MTGKNSITESQTLPIRNILLIPGIVLLAANLRPAITSVGPLIDFIRKDMGLSNTDAGLVTTLPLIGFAVMSLISPKISHRIGNERALFVGMIILLCGIFIRSVSLTAALFSGAALVGFGIAICNVLLPGFIKDKFPEKVGLMTSVYSTGMVVFAAFASGLSVPLAQGLGIGWQKALESWGILVVMAIMVWLPQLPIHHDKSVQPQKIATSQKRLWFSPLAWKVTIFMGLQAFTFFSIAAWLPVILHDKGMSVSMAGWMLSLMQFASLPATFLAPVLADRLKDQRLIVLSIGFFYFLGYGGLLAGGNIFFMIVCVVFAGCASGSSISLSLAFLGLRATDSHQAAALSGMAQSFGYLLASIGPILIGFLFDLTHSWTLPLLTLLGIGVILVVSGLGAGRHAYV